MFERVKYHWLVRLVPNGGTDTIDYRISNYWSPKQEGTAEAIGLAAKAGAFWDHKKQVTFGVASVELV